MSASSSASFMANLLANNSTTNSSTIYHSPQSSPSGMGIESTATCQTSPMSRQSPPHNLMAMLTTTLDNEHSEEENKPLDFSRSKCLSSPSTVPVNCTKKSFLHHKKVHPKFMAGKQQAQQVGRTTPSSTCSSSGSCEAGTPPTATTTSSTSSSNNLPHHCFTTPSPSPPEHRQPTPATSSSVQFSINQLVNAQPPEAVRLPTNNKFDMNKLIQEMSHINNGNNAHEHADDHEHYETLLSQALQLAKLANGAGTFNATVPTAAQLISLLSAAANGQLSDHNPLSTNHTMSSIKSSLTNAKHHTSPTSQLLNDLVTNHHSNGNVNHDQSLAMADDGTSSCTAFTPFTTNQHGLLTTATPPTAHHNHHSGSSSSSSLLVGETANQVVVKNGSSPPSSNMIGGSSPPSAPSKYTRPFKALYNSKDLKESLLAHSTPPTSNASTDGSSTFALESLAAQSLLNSDQAYQMFRAQMLNTKQRPIPSNTLLKCSPPSSGRRKSNPQQTSTRAAIKSDAINSHSSHDDNSSSSSFGERLMMNSSPVASTASDIITSSTTNHHNNTGCARIAQAAFIAPGSLSVSDGAASGGLVPAPTTTNSSTIARKRGRPLPDDLKDEAYWERRRKNNEAAKRSRDLRRAKEDEIAIRACFLEQENRQLKCQLMQLKLEMEKLKTMLASLQAASATPATTTTSSPLRALTADSM